MFKTPENYLSPKTKSESSKDTRKAIKQSDFEQVIKELGIEDLSNKNHVGERPASYKKLEKDLDMSMILNSNAKETE